MLIQIDERELHSLLAGLRALTTLTEGPPYSRKELVNIATNEGSVDALTPGEIDELCVRLNMAEPLMTAITNMNFDRDNPPQPKGDNTEHGNLTLAPGGGTVGHYRMIPRKAESGSVLFACARKPPLINRLMVRLLLGWKWHDQYTPPSGLTSPSINGIPLTKDINETL